MIMGNKARPNKLIREYGRATKAGVVFVKKRNPALSTSQWKKRALGLYGSLLVFSEVGAEDAVKEDDKTTEELEIPRSAQVVIHSVLGMACVCVETARHPLIFRPLDERQSHQLEDWMNAIRTAATPPKPGSLDPLQELEALMKRKDLTTVEAQRAQILMKDYGMVCKGMVCKERGLMNSTEYMTVASDGSTPITSRPPSGNRSRQGSGASLFGTEPSTPAPIVAYAKTGTPQPMIDIISEGLKSTLPTASAEIGNLQPTTRSVFMGSLAASYPEAQAAFHTPNPGDEGMKIVSERPTDPPQGIEILSAIRDADGNYEGYIAVDGACMDALGVCIGYLNDVERTAGSAQGEYLGFVTEPQHGEAMIERPDGTQLAVLELGRTQLKTLSGSTVAQFKMNGQVIANLGHQICSFDALSFHDQPTMALYLSFINPALLTKAANMEISASQQPLLHSKCIKTPEVVALPTPHILYPPASPNIIARGIDTTSRETHLQNVRLRCLASFTPSAPWQLPANAGETIVVLQEHEDGWATCLDASGFQGMLPSTYLDKSSLLASKPDAPCVICPSTGDSEYSTASQSHLNSVASASVSPYENVPIGSLNERSTPPCNSPVFDRKLKVAIASFDADTAQKWQVSLRRNEPCNLVKDHGDGWASIVKANGVEGMVPLSFLCPLDHKMTSPPPSHSAPFKLQPGVTCRVLKHFSVDDVSWQVDVETDDEVELQGELDDGWSSVLHLRSGKCGFVPSGFLAAS